MPQKALGFTLIELIVALTVVAILSTIGITSFSRTSTAARDAKKRADIDSIAKAYEEVAYDQGTNTYRPLTTNDFSAGTIPTPPDNTSYSGLISSAVSSFTICATLSNNTQYCRSSSLGGTMNINPTFTPTP